MRFGLLLVVCAGCQPQQGVGDGWIGYFEVQRWAEAEETCEGVGEAVDAPKFILLDLLEATELLEWSIYRCPNNEDRCSGPVVQVGVDEMSTRDIAAHLSGYTYFPADDGGFCTPWYVAMTGHREPETIHLEYTTYSRSQLAVAGELDCVDYIEDVATRTCDTLTVIDARVP